MDQLMNEVYHVMTIQEMEKRMDKHYEDIKILNDIINEHTDMIKKQNKVINDLTDIINKQSYNINQLIDDITETKTILKLVLAIGPKDSTSLPTYPIDF